MKKPLTEQGKTGSPISLPFHEFKLGHVPLDHAIVDRKAQPRLNCLFVFRYPRSKTMQFGKIALGNMLQPVIETVCFSLAKHGEKLLSESIGQRKARTRQTEQLKGLLFKEIELVGIADKKPDSGIGSPFLETMNIDGNASLCFFERFQIAIDGALRASVALCLDLPVNGLAISLSSLPTREDRGSIDLETARLPSSSLAIGSFSLAFPSSNRPPGYWRQRQEK
jgi:hypothetical protein